MASWLVAVAGPYTYSSYLSLLYRITTWIASVCKTPLKLQLRIPNDSGTGRNLPCLVQIAVSLRGLDRSFEPNVAGFRSRLLNMLHTETDLPTSLQASQRIEQININQLLYRRQPKVCAPTQHKTELTALSVTAKVHI